MAITVTANVTDANQRVFPASATATQSTGSIPLTWNDPRFASNKPGTVYSNPVSQGPTGTIANLDWNGNPGYANGDQCWTCNATLNMNQCRVDWREGPRIATNGTFTVNESYINCVGKNTDHADAFQAYDPGGNGNFIVNNSCIRAYSDQAAVAKYGSGFVGSTALFWADSYQGSVTFNNVLLIGGSRVISIYADSGTTHVNFNNVYFVPDPGQVWQVDARPTGGKLTVDNWTNVRNATIVNGVIVPGSLIPHP